MAIINCNDGCGKGIKISKSTDDKNEICIKFVNGDQSLGTIYLGKKEIKMFKKEIDKILKRKDIK
jgi:hypothetical protein